MKAIVSALVFCLLSALFLVACKKPVVTAEPVAAFIDDSSGSYSMDSVKVYLRNHLPPPVFRTVDSTGFDSKILNRLLYVRVPFIGIPMEQKFILLTIDPSGVVIGAGTIYIDLSLTTLIGRFRSEYLDGTPALNGAIEEGHIKITESQVSVNQSATEPLSLVVPTGPVYTALPEVIVYPSNGDPYYYLPAIRLLAPHQIYNPAGVGNSAGGASGSGFATYTRAASSGVPGANRNTLNRPSTLTVELSYAKPAINLNSYLKCFDQVPDAGAQYSVQVMVDLPVNDDPSVSFNYLTGAVGHVFMAYTKTSGATSVTQCIGFAATQPFKAMFLTTPVTGKLVDNEGHKYNARYTIPVSASGFASALNATSQQVGSYYDLANFNCVDFTLGIVNSISPNSLSVQPTALPGSPVLMSTPGSLYTKLSQMKAAGNQHIENNGIWLASDSHGACN